MNTAARNETICRRVGYDIVVSKSMKEAAEFEFALLNAGNVKLKGKAGRSPIFIVVGGLETLRSLEFRELIESHNLLVQALSDASSQLDWRTLLDRCLACSKRVEPNLNRFYETLPDRLEDFKMNSTDSQN